MQYVTRFLCIAILASCLTFAFQSDAQAQYAVVQPVAPAVVGYTAERRGLFGRRVVYRPVVAPVAAAVPLAPAVAVARPVITTPTVAVARPVIAAPTVTVARPVLTVPGVTVARPVLTAPTVTVARPVVSAPVVTVARPIVPAPVVAPVTSYYAPVVIGF